MPPARIGIVGCAAIAGKNRRAIVASGNIVAAVASRTLSKAQAWAAEAVASGDVPQLPAAYGSYEALLSDRTIDAIYMPLPCGTHVEWVLAAAAAGKGVLVEKPAAVSVDALERMITACADARVPLMDGTMFHYHSRMPLMEAIIHDEAAFGRIGRVNSAFSFRGDDAFFASNIRTSSELEPFGALGDLGQYSIRFGLWAMRWELPASVRAVAHRRNDAGVPLDCSATFSWPSGGPDDGPRTLVIDAAFTLAFTQWAEVRGSRGVLTLDDFVISRTHVECSFTHVLEPGLDAAHSAVVGASVVTSVKGCNQEAEMWRAFTSAVGEGQQRFVPAWARQTLATQACLDAAMASMAADGASVAVRVPHLLAPGGALAGGAL